MENSNKKINIIALLFNILSLITVIVIIYFLIIWNKENKENRELNENLISDANISSDSINIDGVNVQKLNVDFNSLKSQNNETVGWIRVNDTNINYPVVQHSNNSYYLTHGFDKKYNKSGSIFANSKNKFNPIDKNIIIYGHNRRNGAMFSSLNSTLKDSWYTKKENQYINFNTTSVAGIWKIFSIYKIKSKDATFPISFASNTEFSSFINLAINRSIYNFNETANFDDNILTLSTCGNNNAYRIIIHAKLVFPI